MASKCSLYDRVPISATALFMLQRRSRSVGFVTGFVTGYVTGHDFSRATKANHLDGGL
jgi:hypothetical protein